MKKRLLTDVEHVQMMDVKRQAIHAYPFLIKNAKLLLLSDQSRKVVQATKIFSTTPCSNVFTHIMSSDKAALFDLLDLSLYKDDIPDILTLNDISVDGKYLDPAPPAGFTGIWLNVTPILAKRQKSQDDLQISDIPRLTQLVTRGALVMSYHDSDAWLTPQLAAFVIETYSQTCAYMCRQLYNLDLDEQKLVRTWFAAHYAQVLGAADHDLAYPPLLNRCGFLGTVAEITTRLAAGMETLKEQGSQELTFNKVCEILAKHGPARMNTLHAMTLRRMLSLSATDSISMSIALDFPPYWVYQLLKSISGGKNPVIMNTLIQYGMKPKVVQFAEDLLTAESFIGAIKR